MRRNTYGTTRDEPASLHRNTGGTCRRAPAVISLRKPPGNAIPREVLHPPLYEPGCILGNADATSNKTTLALRARQPSPPIKLKATSIASTIHLLGKMAKVRSIE